MDLGPGVGKLGPQGEGVDIGHLAIDGVGGNIADAVIICQSTGNGTGDKLPLIDPAIVGADAGIGLVYGAVEKFHLGMLYRGF